MHQYKKSNITPCPLSGRVAKRPHFDGPMFAPQFLAFRTVVATN